MALDGPGFDRAYRAHAARLRAVAYDVLRDRDAAEDAVHGALVRVWSAGAYRPERGALLPFLIACVRREALDALRTAKRRHLREARASAGDPLAIDDTAALDPVEAARVKRALGELPGAQREVIVRAYFGHRTLAEVAHDTGVPVGTVKSRLVRRAAKSPHRAFRRISMNHLDDDAELYALGLTERERDAEIEAHLASCADCRARVAAAEEAAASLAAALPPMPAAAPARTAWWPAVASAAAVVFAAAAAFEGIAAHDASARIAQTNLALVAIAGSHFSHTTLASGPGITAKALYARDGAWCYVVVSGAPRGAHVVLRRGATAHDAGALGAGDPATLFVRGAGRGDEIEIVAGNALVAHGVPVY